MLATQSDVFSGQVVISAVGVDRPGLVAAMTHAIAESGGNIEDSSMTRLAGQFAMIVIVSVSTLQQVTSLKQQLVRLEDALYLRSQCSVLATPVTNTATVAPSKEEAFILTVAGADRTGITAAVSELLAQHEANITDLNAHRLPKQVPPVYIMVVEFTLASADAATLLTQALQALGQKLNLDVSLRPVDVFEL
jgi:glycine cleavage system transcriptional repressor